MKLKSLLAPVALAALLATGGAAQASFDVFTTQASFIAAVLNPGTDSFDDLDYTNTLPTPQNRSTDLGSTYKYTAQVGPSSVFFPASDDGLDVWLASNNRLDTITFNNLGPGINAIGGYFFGSDSIGLSTAAPVITVSATDASGTLTQSLLNPTTGTFLGFRSTGAITSLKVWVDVQGTGTAGVWPTINDLTLAVPEAQTYAMMLGGLALLGWAARRKPS